MRSRFGNNLSIKRKLLVVLLALGAVGGFASGAMSMCRHHRWRHEAFKDYVTGVCSDAVRNAEAGDSAK